MKFIKYPSINSRSNRNFCNAISLLNMTLLPCWCVSEKVHGANFGIYCDGKEIKFAKRSAFVGNEENFYCAQSVVDRLTDNIWKLYNSFFIGKELILYGELFGGNYPHPDVVKKNISTIQKDVFYCPDVDFYGFDIKVNGEFLDVAIYESLYEEYGFFYAKTFFRGTLEECLEIKPEFQTKIPEKYGLPEIKDNICEGIVIKPGQPTFLPNKDRIIIKVKNEKFLQYGWKPQHELTKGIQEMVNVIKESRIKDLADPIYSNEFYLGKYIKKFNEGGLDDR